MSTYADLATFNSLNGNSSENPQTPPASYHSTKNSNTTDNKFNNSSTTILSQFSPSNFTQSFARFQKNSFYFHNLSNKTISSVSNILKTYKATRINVYPNDGILFSGDILFKTTPDAEKAFALLNGMEIDNQGTKLLLSIQNDISEPKTLSNLLTIKHLPKNTNLESLYDFLRTAGPISELRIPQNNKDLEEDIAFVRYFCPESELIALQDLMLSNYKGNLITLKVVPEKVQQKTQKTNHVPDTQKHDNKLIKHQSLVNSPELPTKSDIPEKTEQTFTKTKHHKDLDLVNSKSKPSSEIYVPGKLIIKNLDHTVSHSELFQLFKPFGYIHSARVIIDPDTRKSMGYGIIQLGNPNDALSAMTSLKGLELKNKVVTIEQFEHFHRSKKIITTNRRDSGNSEYASDNTLYLESENSPEYNRKKNSIGITNSLNKNICLPVVDLDVVEKLSFLARSELLAKNIINSVCANEKVDLEKHILVSAEHSLNTLTEITVSIATLPPKQILEMVQDDDLMVSKWTEAYKNPIVNDKTKSISNVVKQLWRQKLEIPDCDTPNTEKSNQLVNNRISTSSRLTEKLISEGLQGINHPKSTTDVFSSTRELRSDTSSPTKYGIKVKGYDTLIENFIEDLKVMPVMECKHAIGMKLFPLIKDLNYENPSKLTAWILDTMINDIRKLAYAMSNISDLKEIADSALESFKKVSESQS
ncbi:hypothetical protein BB559_002260 [Furculomyces boomerangus]|uniref:Uncharacterized protein n=2 Tax=Harpellales TaxID=61421 RepID=A0A2T9YFQ7_9FUNG|nr:hypothetical protein BB559_004255 [Furculomyces boomerangus]PVU96758.1 hypothetical protein BB559_002260 [Furculomyces boomerangus]PWA03811.1 hypothetical protein BB558_000022 [Smittium angustum]